MKKLIYKRIHRDLLLAFLLFCLTSIYSCGNSSSKSDKSGKQKIIFAISASSGSIQHETSEEFTRRVNEKLPETHKLIFYGSSQLGKDKDLMQKLKLGTVHLTLPSSTMSTLIPKFGIFEMPFLIKDRNHLLEIEKEIFWSQIAPEAEKRGYKLIGLWENGFRHMTNNKKPIHQPEDLKGIKLRTPRSSWRVKMFRDWGGNPTPMAFSEVFVALQTGVIDGQENPLTNIYAGKIHEVQDYLSLSSHVYMPAYLTSGVKTWEKFPEEIQRILKNTAEEVSSWMYEKAKKQENELIKVLKEKGMKVNEIDREKFKKSCEGIYLSYGKEIEGGDLIIQRCQSLSAS